MDTTPQHTLSLPPPVDRYEETKSKVGFLGFTSVSSIITEDLGNLGVVSAETKPTTAVSVILSDEQLSKGYQVLALLQDRKLVDRCMDSLFDSIDGPAVLGGEYVAREWLSHLWISHGDTLKRQNGEEIQKLCQLIYSNTRSTPKVDGSTTPLQWIRSGTGTNLRWEIIGMIVAYVGMYAMTAAEQYHIRKDDGIDYVALYTQMYEGVELCLDFCRKCDTLTDVFVWVLYTAHGLLTGIGDSGCTSYALYRLGGELNSAAIAMGLNQEIKADRRTPFFLAEFRKGLRARIYTNEVSTALFLGRPPRLSYRHWNLDPPLDLTESQLLQTAHELSNTIGNLDANGYNQCGEIRFTTFLRMDITMAKGKEEIMDLALGNLSREEVLDRSKAIEEMIERHIESLPDFVLSLIRHGKVMNEKALTGPMDKLLTAVVRHYGQSIKLHLQRVLIRKAGAGSAELIQTARQTLQMFMETSEDKELTAYLALHGIRSAVILAIELLKQENLPVYPQEPLLPRSQTIQDLSVFVAKLSKVNPITSMSALCARGRSVISQILDKILSPPNRTNRHTPFHSPFEDGNENTMAQISFDNEKLWSSDDLNLDLYSAQFGTDVEFKDWLENMDWSA